MASTTWDAIFPGRQDLIRKYLFGSVLVQDYSGTNTFSTYSPFDSTTGNLATTLLTTDGWNDMGYLDENGVEFTPNYAIATTGAWQTRLEIRADATKDDETAKFTCVQSNDIVDALYYNTTIASNKGNTGQSGYTLKKPLQPVVTYRSILFLGVDGSGTTQQIGGLQYMAKLYPKCLVTKPEKQGWSSKTEAQYPLTITPYPDPVSGYAIKIFRDGPGWRALGVPLAPTSLTLGTTTATSQVVNWTAPSTVTGFPAATNYTVSNVKSSNGVAVGTFSPVNPNATTSVTISGLTTATNYTATIQSNDAFGSGGSASITFTTS